MSKYIFIHVSFSNIGVVFAQGVSAMDGRERSRSPRKKRTKKASSSHGHGVKEDGYPLDVYPGEKLDQRDYEKRMKKLTRLNDRKINGLFLRKSPSSFVQLGCAWTRVMSWIQNVINILIFWK